jgi:hypothetical protein
MMFHPVVAGVAVLALVFAAALATTGGPRRVPAIAAGILAGVLVVERALAGVRAYRGFGDPAALLFPALHLVRDLVWVGAGLTWLYRRMLGRHVRPSHSMRPRPLSRGSGLPALAAEETIPHSLRVLALIPAHNEASNLPSVVKELRTCCPMMDVLVVDDGSTDDTAGVLDALECQWLRFPERMGIGSAVRAGLRYASRMGYGLAVRLDGDGQHCAGDIEQLVAPLRNGYADVVLGSRYIDINAAAAEGLWRGEGSGSERVPLRLLAGCLSALTGKPVTDPTSGFCAFGPRAIRLLAEHHPTGYPEPELRLFLSRNQLRVSEVAVLARPRLAGRTSLTPVRVIGAGARVLLALVIEPLRAIVRTPP